MFLYKLLQEDSMTDRKLKRKYVYKYIFVTL